MRKLVIGLMMLTLVAVGGCGGMEIKDDFFGKGTGYTAGKGVGFAVNKVISGNGIASLEANFDAFMLRNAGLEMVSPEESIALYTDSILIMTLEVADPYGLISDLTFLLSMFGGQVVEVPGEGDAEDGIVIEGLNPIPLNVYKSFEWGYDSGKRLAEAGV